MDDVGIKSLGFIQWQKVNKLYQMMSSMGGWFGPNTSARAEGLVASPWSKDLLRVPS